jgi:hypothetical protein
MSDEFVFVPRKEWIWWDLDRDTEFTQSMTGTHNLERRYVEKPPIRLHAADLGRFVAKWDTRWEGLKSYTTWWLECEKCGKHFNEQEL